jgi:hypothetical protein
LAIFASPRLALEILEEEKDNGDSLWNTFPHGGLALE